MEGGGSDEWKEGRGRNGGREAGRVGGGRERGKDRGSERASERAREGGRERERERGGWGAYASSLACEFACFREHVDLQATDHAARIARFAIAAISTAATTLIDPDQPEL